MVGYKLDPHIAPTQTIKLLGQAHTAISLGPALMMEHGGLQDLSRLVVRKSGVADCPLPEELDIYTMQD